MKRVRGGLPALAALAAASAGTTWAALFAWRGFTEQWGRSLGPLLVLGVVVAGVGTLARWWRLPAPAVLAAQLVTSGALASTMLCGSPIPVGPAWLRLHEAFVGAITSADRYAPPVPAHAAGVHPLLIVGGLACLLLVDLLACTLRRVSLAGLPLLTVYCIPVSLLHDGISWWVFVLAAGGFMLMLFLQEDEQVSRWGRALGTDHGLEDPSGFGVRTGAVRASAGTIGGVATAIAVFLPLLIPTFHPHLLNGGNGPGGDSQITIENPMTDLRRDLQRGQDIPLLRVTTDDPHPSYLRISVLTRFSDNEWSSGDREVPPNQRADGPLPSLQGVDASVRRTEHQYSISATPDFNSLWLPTQAPITSISATGDWRYDSRTMDFLAGSKDLSTAGQIWSMTGVSLALSAVSMARAPATSGTVSGAFTELPSDMPPVVRNLAFDVTRNAPSRFEKAVALQDWFRTNGGFTYDLHAAPGNGTNDLVAFLTEGAGGRTGYCEQFASAMAVMARALGIPARVAVGFLEPQAVGPDTWEYSAWDMHAWPELFFPGSGWVRFEPTPPGRASAVPGYTAQQVPQSPENPGIAIPRSSDLPSRGGESSSAASPSAATPAHAHARVAFAWAPVVGGLLVLLVGGALLIVPRLLRRSRRDRRLLAGLEAGWAELHDAAIDLGVAWPEGRSPRDTRDHLVRFFGRPVDESTPERPAHGPEVFPRGVAALDRLVGALERLRYSRSGTPDPAADQVVRLDVELCLAALQGGATRGARRRAEWWPRSVVRRSRRAVTGQPSRPMAATHGGVVDHVG